MLYQRIHILRWIRSALAIMAICLLLSTLVCTYVLRVLESSLLESNAHISGYVQKSVDSRFDELHRYTLSIEIGHANGLLKDMAQLPARLPEAVYQLSNALRDFIGTNKLARGIYLYYPQTDFVVGNMGCYKAASYYALQGMPHRDRYDEWIEALTSDRHEQFVLLPTPSGQRLCYVRKMRMTGDASAVVVVEIDDHELLMAFGEAFAHRPIDSGLGIMVYDRIVASTGDEALFLEVPVFFSQWVQEGTDHIRQGNRLLFFNESFLPGMYYVNISSAQSLLQPAHWTLQVCIVGTGLSLLISAAVSVLIIRVNTRPMRHLLTRFEHIKGEEKDEYAYINARIDQLLAEKNKSQQLMQEHQLLLNALFLEEVLQGNLHSESAVFSAAKQCEIAFEHTSYQIVVLSGVLPSNFTCENVIASLSAALEKSSVDNWIAIHREYIVILLNTEGTLQNEYLYDIAYGLMDDIYMGQEARAGIGPCCDNMTDIISSYQCALYALKEADPVIAHAVKVYSPAPSQYPPGDNATLQAFAQLINKKKYLQAQGLVEQLYEEYLGAPLSETVHTVRQNAVYNLLSDALFANLPGEEAAIKLQMLVEMDSISESKLLVQHILQLIAKQNNTVAHVAQGKKTVAQQAKEIIDDNFSDSMMGVYMIAERLHVTNSYLSTVYKNTYGIRLIQYMNGQRIEKAKALITTTKMSIKDIAVAVGFSSDIQFIRVFKKYENLTPSSLRKQAE